MQIIYFIMLDDKDRFVLSGAQISEQECDDGFYVDNRYIAPHEIFHSESDALQVLYRLAAECGRTVRSALH